MILQAFSDGRFRIGDRWTRCAIGRGGVVPQATKREGDGASPAGAFAMTALLCRGDRPPPPPPGFLVARVIAPGDGWSDDPDDPAYNTEVSHPHPFSAERLWRDDHLYDLVVVLDHNQAPAVPGAGSAIFLHLATDDFSPTQGCVALKRADLEEVLRLAKPHDRLEIIEADPPPGGRST